MVKPNGLFVTSKKSEKKKPKDKNQVYWDEKDYGEEIGLSECPDCCIWHEENWFVSQEIRTYQTQDIWEQLKNCKLNPVQLYLWSTISLS